MSKKPKVSRLKKQNVKHRLRVIRQYLWKHKLVSFALIVVVLYGEITAYNLYDAYLNRKYIVGLSENLPKLAADIEKATGVELKISSSCMTTGELHGPGVRVCGVIVYDDIPKNTDSGVISSYTSSIENNHYGLSKGKIGENKAGYYYNYIFKSACTALYKDIRIDCTVAPTPKNEKLAVELLNQDKLTQKKNEYIKSLE